MSLPFDVPARLPRSRVPDPHDAPGIRWGILGPGTIAHTFAEAVEVGTESTVVAVGSRDLGRAHDFASTHGVSAAYGSYDDLVADPDVDAVYVATPHSEHRAHALLAIEAGKPVLVEKSFTRNATEAREVFAAAERAGVLAAEAMWSRYLPHYDVVRQAVEGGLVGDVLTVVADHSQPLHPDGPARLADPELAGGALLDLGVYPVSFADLVCGPPSAVTARGRLTDRGVDATASMILEYASGANALLSTTMEGAGPCTAVVVGTRGRLEIDGWFYQPSAVRLIGPRRDLLDELPGGLPADARGFSYEIAEVARCVTAGRLETPVMPWATTIRVMETMDEVRRQLGVVYPGE